MAQDLGLHRRLGTERKEQSEADHAELRRRVWGGCLIADRWMAAIVRFSLFLSISSISKQRIDEYTLDEHSTVNP